MTTKDNKKKIILDLCGGTGAWSRPYVEAGYNVQIVTLPYLPLFDDKPGDVCFFEPPENTYGILASPPCEEFSLAKQNSRTPRNFKHGLEVVHACLQIIWKCRLRNCLKFWALENPRGYLRQFFGIAPFQFEQWEFGDNGIKPTEIWGYYRFPKKTVTRRPKTKFMATVQGFNGVNRKAARAITPPGFAKAFFEANR